MSILIGGQPMGIGIDSDRYLGPDLRRRPQLRSHHRRLRTLAGPDRSSASCRSARGPMAWQSTTPPATSSSPCAASRASRWSTAARTTPTVLGTIELEAAPAWVAIDQTTRRAFVSLLRGRPGGGARAHRHAAVLRAGRHRSSRAPIRAGSPSTRPPAVSSSPTTASPSPRTATSGTARCASSTRAPRPRSGSARPSPPASPPASPSTRSTGNAYVLENGSDELPDARLPGRRRGAAHGIAHPGRRLRRREPERQPGRPRLPAGDARAHRHAGQSLDLVERRPPRRSSGSTPLAVPRWTGPSRRPRTRRASPSTPRAAASSSRRSRRAASRRSTTSMSPPSPPPPPPSIAVSMPSPLQVSLAPEDVVRTVGISLLVLLLVGAPTPIFNETLESNLGVIQGGLRRLVPGGRGASSRWQVLGARLERFSASFLGLAPLHPRGRGHLLVPDAGLPGQRRGHRPRGSHPGHRGGHGGRHPARPALRRRPLCRSRQDPDRGLDPGARRDLRAHLPDRGPAAGLHVRDHRDLHLRGRS